MKGGPHNSAPTRAPAWSANVPAMNPRLAEAERTAGDLVRFGKIAEVDLDAGRCVVSIGDLKSAPLPWFAGDAGPEAATWDPPEVGAQAVVLCAEGDLAAGLVLAGVYSDAVLQLLGDFIGRAMFGRVFRDQAKFSYDPEGHELLIELPAGGRVRLVAPEGFDLEGEVRILGDLKVDGDTAVTGEVEAEGDVKGKGVSLANHPHDKVQPGAGLSGKPVAS